MSVPRSILDATESMANKKCDLSDINPDPAIRMTPYGEQDENGVDVSLIRANLR